MTGEMAEEDKVLEVLLWIRNLPSPYITEAEESDTSDSLVKYPSDPESPKSLPSRKSSLDSPRSSSPTIRPSPGSKGKSCKRVKK
ncbi:MAG: hypothetical protein LQ340_006739 [Diploschistes diacapsis]|nr:MAG: hypothetical protein LQ340_006739 [Diploschistes diacapsis]